MKQITRKELYTRVWNTPIRTLAANYGLSDHLVQQTTRLLEVRSISTMRKYVEAMGGELEIIAKFQEGDVKVKKFRFSSYPTGGSDFP